MKAPRTIYTLPLIGIIIAILNLVVGCTTMPDTQPQIVHRENPVYPSNLFQAGVTGSATVDFVVSTEGFVKNATIVQATHPLFGEAALKAIHRWKFKPGILNGHFAAAHMVQDFQFDIQAAK